MAALARLSPQTALRLISRRRNAHRGRARSAEHPYRKSANRPIDSQDAVFEFCPRQQRKTLAAMAGSLALHAACISAALLVWAGSPVRVTHHVYTWLYAPPLGRPETAPPSAALSSPHHHARVAPRLWLPSPPPRQPVQLPAAPELTPVRRMIPRAPIATTPSLPPPPAAPRVAFEAGAPGPRPAPGNLDTGVFGVVSPRVETSAILKQAAETGFNARIPALKVRPRASAPLSTGMFGDSSAGIPARIRRPATATSGFDAETSGSATPAHSAARVSTGAFGGSTAIFKPVRFPASKVCAGFDPQTATVAAVAHSPSPQLSVMRTVLEILHKPRPAYTDEARKLGIEGDVVLEVWFGPNGLVRVGRILRGLGHGLDEQAARAATDILFRPATERVSLWTHGRRSVSNSSWQTRHETLSLCTYFTAGGRDFVPRRRCGRRHCDRTAAGADRQAGTAIRESITRA